MRTSPVMRALASLLGLGWSWLFWSHAILPVPHSFQSVGRDGRERLCVLRAAVACARKHAKKRGETMAALKPRCSSCGMERAGLASSHGGVQP